MFVEEGKIEMNSRLGLVSSFYIEKDGWELPQQLKILRGIYRKFQQVDGEWVPR